jgi:hypothetical protein
MNIHWQGNRSAVVASSGDYTLRAWRTEYGSAWAWVCRYNGEVVDRSSAHGNQKKTRIAAQRAAEAAMNEHINKQQSEK